MNFYLHVIFHRLRNIFKSQYTPENRGIGLYKSKIDMFTYGKIKRKYENKCPYPGYSKYLDIEKYLNVALCHYDIAEINDNKKISILDIGTGAGYFPFICMDRGHKVESIDVPDNEFYDEMISLLGVKRYTYRIQPFKPLPVLDAKYDLITAFAVCFNSHASDNLWGVEEWEFFISDLSSTKAKYGAKLILKLNLEPDGKFYSDDLRHYFESLGANIDNDLIKIPFKN